MGDHRLPAVQRLDPFANKMFTGTNDLFAPFLGPVPQTLQTDGYERRAVDKWNMPEAYRQRNLYIRDTVEDMVWTADQTWYTAPDGVLPWKITDELHLQWTNLTAHAHIMDVTPYQSTSSMTTQERQIRRANLIRRGIAAEFEHDFLKTPLGRVSFLATLNQISRSVQETANIEVLRALVQAHRYQHEWQRKYGIIRDKDLKSYLESDRFRFAVAQKTKNGLEKLNSLINAEVRDAGGRTNAWILPEEVSRYTELGPPEKTDYYLAGSAGPDRINGEGSKLLARAGTTDPLDRVEPRRLIHDVPVYLARAFNVPDMPKLDVLTRVRQIGEYNTMIDETTDYTKYTTESRNIAIYNEDIDDFSKITLEDAIENCGLWDETKPDGPVKPLTLDNRSGGNRRDAQRDFLTYVTDRNNVQTVQLVGHIDPFFLPVKTLLAVAQTLDNRISGEPDQAAVLSQILGFPVAAADIAGQVTVPVIRRGNADVPQIGNEVQQVESGFFQMLAQSAPSSKRQEIKDISEMEGSFMDRVNTIKDKFHEYATDKVKGTKLKKADQVDQFFADRMNQYEAVVSEASQPRVESGKQVEGEIVGYRAPGQDLSGTDVQYLYKGSERKSTGNRVHDSSSVLRRLSDQLFDLQQSRQAARGGRQPARARDTGSGMGLEGISMMAFGDTSGRQGMRDVDPVIAELTGRLDALGKHQDNLNSSGGSARLRALAVQFAGMPMTKSSMLRLARNNIGVPLNFLLFRPHMQYKTKMGIKVATGGRAGHVYYGHSNAMIQGEVSRKISQIHFTLHMRAVVEEPRNVYVQPDLYCEEYQGGNGIKFYNPETYRARDNSRLKYSIICVAIPPAERDIPNPMDTSGRFYTEYSAGLLTEEEFNELHYTTAYRYNVEYGFYMGARREGADLPNYAPSSVVDNRIMYQGHQWMWNSTTGAFDRVRTNKGHWGKNVYAGCGEVRNGNLKYLDRIDYTKFSTI